MGVRRGRSTRTEGAAGTLFAASAAVVCLLAMAGPGGAQDAARIPGFAILPAPSVVPEAQLPDLIERYVDAYRDPRPLQGWGGDCGLYARVPCAPVLYRCVRDIKWGCPDEDFLRQFLPPFRALVDRMPGDRFATGQGVYAFLGLGRIEDAAEIAGACTASESWCSMLDAIIAYEQGRFADAHTGYEGALEGMPEADRCAFTDLKWLFERSGEYRGLDCAEREATNQVTWWLSDPLWSEPGNSRRLAHWHRSALNLLHDDFLELENRPGAVVDDQGHPLSHHNSTMRYGLDGANGVAMDPSRGGSWSPAYATEYHFVPPFDAVLDPWSASADTWEILPGRPWEFFEDPTWTHFVELPHQVAAFSRGDRKIVLAAAELTFVGRFSPPAETRAALVLSSGPGAFVTTADSTSQRIYRLRDTVPEGDWMVGVEVMADREHVAGRARMAAGPPAGPRQRVSISDLLFFTPGPDSVAPQNLDDAGALMLGRDWVTPSARLGVFWEIYGALPDELTTLEITAIPDRGVFGRIGRFLGIGDDDLVIGWNEGAITGPDGEVARAVVLDMDRFEPGRYTVQIRIGVLGQETVVGERGIEVR